MKTNPVFGFEPNGLILIYSFTDKNSYMNLPVIHTLLNNRFVPIILVLGIKPRMKKQMLCLLMLICLFFSACKKNKHEITDQILGKWELRAFFYTQAAIFHREVYPRDNGNIYDFQRNNVLFKYSNAYTPNPLKTTYTLYKQAAWDGQIRDFIQIGNDTLNKSFVTLNGTMLKIQSNLDISGGYELERVE